MIELLSKSLKIVDHIWYRRPTSFTIFHHTNQHADVSGAIIRSAWRIRYNGYYTRLERHTMAGVRKMYHNNIQIYTLGHTCMAKKEHGGVVLLGCVWRRGRWSFFDTLNNNRRCKLWKLEHIRQWRYVQHREIFPRICEHCVWHSIFLLVLVLQRKKANPGNMIGDWRWNGKHSIVQKWCLNKKIN